MGRKGKVRRDKAYYQAALRDEREQEEKLKARMQRRAERLLNHAEDIAMSENPTNPDNKPHVRVKKPKGFDKRTRRAIRKRQNQMSTF